MSDKEPKDLSRRSLIKGLGLVAGAGVLVGATGRVIAKEQQPQASEAGKGYRETPHIHDYYRSLRGTD